MACAEVVLLLCYSLGVFPPPPPPKKIKNKKFLKIQHLSENERSLIKRASARGLLARAWPLSLPWPLDFAQPGPKSDDQGPFVFTHLLN